MAMPPLTHAERDGMRARLGPDPIARMDALVCAGYVLHACGDENPATYVDSLVILADYLVTGRAREALHLHRDRARVSNERESQREQAERREREWLREPIVQAANAAAETAAW